LSLASLSYLYFNCSILFTYQALLIFTDIENESFVTFKATIFCQNEDSSIVEKNRFIKELNKWYYIDGVFLDNL
jgi:SEC-C motif-containing protein